MRILTLPAAAAYRYRKPNGPVRKARPGGRPQAFTSCLVRIPSFRSVVEELLRSERRHSESQRRMDQPITALFVYGTLQRGQCREQFWPHPPISVEGATIRGQL